MIETHIGELAALATAICWVATSLAFEAGGKRIGSLAVNFIRLVFAVCFLSAFNWFSRGLLVPVDASPHAWLWLSISGLIGFTLGDMCLFRAFVLIGSRLSALIMVTAPPIAAIISWMILGEALTAMDMAGIALTAVGVVLVLTERPVQVTAQDSRQMTKGVLLALGGAFGQGSGLVLSKYGMGSYSAIAATQIRIIAGIVGLLVVFTIIGWWPRIAAARRSSSGLGFTALGAVFGPFIGVSLSLYAVQHTAAGIAAALMSTTPIFLIPVVAFVYKERVSARSVAATLVAVAGVFLLFK